MFPLHHCQQSQLLAMWDTAIGIRFAYFGQVSWSYSTTWARLASKALPLSDYKVATIGAPAILLEDYHSKAILKFHRSSGLEYRACHGLRFLSFSKVYWKVETSTSDNSDVL